MNRQKGSIVLILLPILVLIGIGIIYLLDKYPFCIMDAMRLPGENCISGSLFRKILNEKGASPTPTPTTNQLLNDSLTSWKTHRNEKYGFEFKYPSSMISSQLKGPDYQGGPVYDDINIKYAESIDKQPYKDRPDLYGYAISLTMYQSSNKEQVIKLFDRSIESCSEQAECSGSTDTQIGGIVAKTYSIKTNLKTYTHMTKYYYFEKNSYLYVFAVGTAGSKDLFDKYTEITSQILSTFRFLDK